MTKSLFMATAALMLLAGNAFAADAPAAASAPASAAPEHKYIPYKDMTLAQAREIAHKKADKLDKMTDEQWNAEKKSKMDKRAERMAKWNAMSPEEQAKVKAERRAKHLKHDAAATSAQPAAGAPASKPAAQ